MTEIPPAAGELASAAATTEIPLSAGELV